MKMNLPGYRAALTAALTSLLSSTLSEGCGSYENYILSDYLRIEHELVEGEEGSAFLKLTIYDGGEDHPRLSLPFDRSADHDSPFITLSYPDYNLLPFAGYRLDYNLDSIRISLKQFSDESFLRLLAEELIFQLAWRSRPLYLLLKSSVHSDFRARLESDFKTRAFIHRLYGEGLAIERGRIYCRTEGELPFLHLPEEGSPILLKADDEDEEQEGSYDLQRARFISVAEPAYNYSHFWRYKEGDKMERLLKGLKLANYKEYILQE